MYISMVDSTLKAILESILELWRSIHKETVPGASASSILVGDFSGPLELRDILWVFLMGIKEQTPWS